MKLSKKPNDAVHLLFDILYEKYKAKICYTPTLLDNSSPNHHHHFTLDEVENENVIIDEENSLERALSEENFILQINKKRGHQKSKSDFSGLTISHFSKSCFSISSLVYIYLFRTFISNN